MPEESKLWGDCIDLVFTTDDNEATFNVKDGDLYYNGPDTFEKLVETIGKCRYPPYTGKTYINVQEMEDEQT